MIYGNQAFSISGDVRSDRFGAIFLPWTVLVQIPEIASNHLERSPVKILFVELVLDWKTSQKVKQISFVPNIRDSASMSNEGLGVKIF